MANRRSKPKTKLKVIPLGGLEEIGKNMTVLEYGNDIVIIDCGLKHELLTVNALAAADYCKVIDSFHIE